MKTHRCTAGKCRRIFAGRKQHAREPARRKCDELVAFHRFPLQWLIVARGTESSAQLIAVFENERVASISHGFLGGGGFVREFNRANRRQRQREIARKRSAHFKLPVAETDPGHIEFTASAEPHARNSRRWRLRISRRCETEKNRIHSRNICTAEFHRVRRDAFQFSCFALRRRCFDQILSGLIVLRIGHWITVPRLHADVRECPRRFGVPVIRLPVDQATSGRFLGLWKIPIGDLFPVHENDQPPVFTVEKQTILRNFLLFFFGRNIRAEIFHLLAGVNVRVHAIRLKAQIDRSFAVAPNIFSRLEPHGHPAIVTAPVARRELDVHFFRQRIERT